MAEAVVVGAGIVGCAVAYELARRGVRVEVLDGREPGGGATQASAGVLSPFIEAETGTLLQDLGVASLDRYDAFMADVTRDSGLPVEYARTGTIEAALDAPEESRLRAGADLLRDLRIEHRLMDGDEARAFDPALAPAVSAALYVAQHGFVSAPALITALVRAATAKGAVFRPKTQISRIVKDPNHPGGGLRIDTPQGSLKTSTVVLAAGSWSPLVESAEAATLPVHPVRGQLLHLKWKATPPTRVIWGSRCYMVPWNDGSVLVGATVEEAGYVEEVTVAGLRSLFAAGAELVPETASAGFTSARVGLRPATLDRLPIIGPSSEISGLIYATGHYRNGVLLTPITALLVADFLTEGRRHRWLDALSLDRFKPVQP